MGILSKGKYRSKSKRVNRSIYISHPRSKEESLRLIFGLGKQEEIDNLLFLQCENIRKYRKRSREYFLNEIGITDDVYEIAKENPSALSANDKQKLMDYIYKFYHRFFVGEYIDGFNFETINIFFNGDVAKSYAFKIGRQTKRNLFIFHGVKDIRGNEFIDYEDVFFVYDRELDKIHIYDDVVKEIERKLNHD